jgi:hypothetical protein
VGNELDDIPTHYDDLLHLLAELEWVVDRGVIQWNEAAALAAQYRLERLAATVGRIAVGIRKH